MTKSQVSLGEIMNFFFSTIYDCDYGRKINEVPAHDDAVSCLAYLDEVGVLISGSWDCTVK